MMDEFGELEKEQFSRTKKDGISLDNKKT